MVLEQLFKKFDFQVEGAQNGQIAFEKVQNSMKNTKTMFDLIIMDINMPVCGGFEACQNIIKLYNRVKLF